jgi:hypothetical protein
MTIHSSDKSSAMDDRVYEALYGKFFAPNPQFQHYVSETPDELASTRHDDIDDSVQRYYEAIAGAFPDTDPATVAGIVTACAVFQRVGCEEGIMFMADQRTSGYDSDASFRRRVIEMPGY